MQSYIGASSCRVLEQSRFLDGDGSPCTREALMCGRCRDASEVQLPASPSVGHGQRLEETDGDDDMGDLQAEAELLQTGIQEQARGLADYSGCLETWRGVCMICYHLPRVASGQVGHARHGLAGCVNPERFRFFEANGRHSPTDKDVGVGSSSIAVATVAITRGLCVSHDLRSYAAPLAIVRCIIKYVHQINSSPHTFAHRASHISAFHTSIF
jgi:hypothetical protein